MVKNEQTAIEEEKSGNRLKTNVKKKEIRKQVPVGMSIEGRRSKGPTKMKDKNPKDKSSAQPDEHDPEALKKFEKFYEASQSAKSINVQGMSKGKRMRAIKKEKLSKKKMLDTFLQKSKDKKGSAFDLGLLDFSEGLNRLVNKHKGTSSKSKQSKGNDDIVRTQMILQNKTFLSDPLGTIRTHLVNTIAVREAEESKLKAAEQKENKKGKKKNIMNIE